MTQEDRAAIRAQREAEIAAMKAEADEIRGQVESTLAQLDDTEAGWKAALAEHELEEDTVLALAAATGISEFVGDVHRKSRADDKPKTRSRKGRKRPHTQV